MKKIAILTGAGMSAESGISTFRGGGGLWDEYPVEQVATPEGYRADPGLVLDFYNKRRQQLLEVVPNRGHELVAELERDFDVTVITQNVDNLHERAGSTKVIHLHGELMKVCSSREPYNEAYVETLTSENVNVKIGDLAADGSQKRPFIVWFGEAVPYIDAAIDHVENADVLLIVGTSLQVYPAAGLYAYAKSDTPIYIIDPGEVRVNDGRITHIKDVATKGMETFKNMFAKA